MNTAAVWLLLLVGPAGPARVQAVQGIASQEQCDAVAQVMRATQWACVEEIRMIIPKKSAFNA